ncbi:hypothetical protein [Streptomyces sp. NPDC096013]|uniref:hypothetical protein n=1 Tax=Streptomyces sp. NPDC096013 TaxID=3366069 RepID=UPI00380F475F
MNRAIVLLSASLIAAPCAIGLSAVPASAAAPAISEPNLPCGTTEPDIDQVTPTYTHVGDSGPVNIRTGTTSSCSIIGNVGVGEAVNFNCYVWDAIGRSWTFLHTSENEHGWVLDSVLPGNGSPVHC